MGPGSGSGSGSGSTSTRQGCERGALRGKWSSPGEAMGHSSVRRVLRSIVTVGARDKQRDHIGRPSASCANCAGRSKECESGR